MGAPVSLFAAALVSGHSYQFGGPFALPGLAMCITLRMASEEVSNIYGRPKFGLIVGMFAVCIVVLLALGWAFMHFDPLHMRKGSLKPSTGMMLLYQGTPLH